MSCKTQDVRTLGLKNGTSFVSGGVEKRNGCKAKSKKSESRSQSKASHDLCDSAMGQTMSASSLIAPELGVHVVLTHLVGAKLATPAVTLRAVLGGVQGENQRKQRFS